MVASTRLKEGPLAGIRVLDFTWAWAGPHGTLLLALLGAEVIKVESRRRLDHTRVRSLMAGPMLATPDHSTIFTDLNVGKLSLSLDLKQPKAVEIARRLVRVCDVVAENMRPGALERSGLGYEALRAVKPDIVMVSSSAVGGTGPERNYAGYAPTFAALGGISSITGRPQVAPSPLSGAVDLRVGTTCALAALAALFHLRRTGEGQFIDVSSAESVSALIGGVFMEQAMNGRAPARAGNRDRSMAPHNCYPCRGGKDGPILGERRERWVSIAVGSDAEWGALCEVLGEPDLERDPRFADVVSRYRHQEELDAIISTWTRRRTAEKAAEALQRAGVAAVPVLDGIALTQDSHVRARGVVEEMEHPVIGSRLVLGAPWRLSDTPAAIRRPSPRLGEHNDYVLGDLLGMEGDEIEELVRDGVLT
jgi:benzylsuccinate CoA-transferase BbsF subunit